VTVVNAETGEVVEPMSEPHARALTDQIKGALIVAYDVLIECWMGRADLALGYLSWDAYCASEFDGIRMVRLPREQRQEIVTAMHKAGMPVRAIGAGLGVDKDTANRDVRASRVPNGDKPGRVPAPAGSLSAAEINALTPQSVIDERDAESERALPAFGIRMALDDLLAESDDPAAVVRDCPPRARDQLDRVPEALAYLTALNQAMETYR